MDESPKKKKVFSLDLYTGSYGSEARELPVEWDVLAAASDRCLVGRVRGFLERKIVRTTPASVLWRLWNYELGEMGTCEVRKIRPGWSRVTFSGLGFKGLENNERWEIKQRHMLDVIDAYYFLLSQENLLPLDVSQAGPETNPIETWLPWMHIPNEGDDRRIVELWCGGEKKTADEISREDGVYSGKNTIYNRLSDLRKKYPEAGIPLRRKSRSKKIDEVPIKSMK